MSSPRFPAQNAFKRLLNRFLPRGRVGTDPALVGSQGRYRPVPVYNLKMPWLAATDLRRSRRPNEFAFEEGKKLTVIIPFRNRDEHLAALRPALEAQLDGQHIDYRILVVEQAGDGIFNKARLINTGILHAADDSDYYCIHDVDNIPVNADYRCPSLPLRLVTKLQTTHRRETEYKDHYFSGAITFRKEHAFAANGLSNQYWGWGKEDDDFFFRLLMQGLCCFADYQGVYRDLANPQSQHFTKATQKRVSPQLSANRHRRNSMLRLQLDPARDGLNSLTYSILAAHTEGRFEKIVVDIGSQG